MKKTTSRKDKMAHTVENLGSSLFAFETKELICLPSSNLKLDTQIVMVDVVHKPGSTRSTDLGH